MWRVLGRRPNRMMIKANPLDKASSCNPPSMDGIADQIAGRVVDEESRMNRPFGLPDKEVRGKFEPSHAR